MKNGKMKRKADTPCLITMSVWRNVVKWVFPTTRRTNRLVWEGKMLEKQARQICEEKLAWPDLELVRVTRKGVEEANRILGTHHNPIPFKGEYWLATSSFGQMARVHDDGMIEDLSSHSW
jgi:hypothetical protein